MDRDVCPGQEPDCLKPAGTWVGVSIRMCNDSNSLGDRAKEGRGSEGIHAGTGERINARMCRKKKKGKPEGAGAPAPEKPSLCHFHYGNPTELGAAGQFVTSLDSSGSVKLSLNMCTTSLDSSGSVAPD